MPEITFDYLLMNDAYIRAADQAGLSMEEIVIAVWKQKKELFDAAVRLRERELCSGFVGILVDCVERLEASDPPEGGATAETITRARKLLSAFGV